MEPTIPEYVQASCYGFPTWIMIDGTLAPRYIRARHLWPLADTADRARIEALCRNGCSYSGEGGDTLGAVWHRLGWPLVGDP